MPADLSTDTAFTEPMAVGVHAVDGLARADDAPLVIGWGRSACGVAPFA